jgi:2-polyprenyl-3-methyl-5-hydroxy-6-metoxy-1,4-benzoquinol methylase
MNASYDEIDAYANSRDPLDRAYLFAAESLFYTAHLLVVVATFPADATFRFLDLGCGDARIARAVAQQFPNSTVVGIDDSARSLELARRLPVPPNLELRRGLIEEIGETQQFDFVVCSEVYEHVDDPLRLLHNAAACLRPGGTLSLSTPSGWMARMPRASILAEAVRHPRRYATRRYPERRWREALDLHPGTRWAVLRRQLNDVGFDIISRTSGLPWVDPGSRSLIYYAQRLRGQRDGRRSLLFWSAGRRSDDHHVVQAQRLLHRYQSVDGLQNWLPILRPLESRMLVVASKRAGQ